MAHSPLFRTLMRSTLDTRCVTLTDYELDTGEHCTDNDRRVVFEASGWTNSRPSYEDGSAEKSLQKQAAGDFADKIIRDTLQESSNNRSQHYMAMRAMFEEVLPLSDARIRLAIANTGFAHWQSPTIIECLRSEDDRSEVVTCGRVSLGERGIIDRRLLHTELSPAFVPKPHVINERKRLEGKYTRFAAFVAEQRSVPFKQRILLPGSRLETSDDGFLPDRSVFSTTELSDSEDETEGSVAAHDIERTEDTERSTKLYDCVVHDQKQLNEQARNLFSLLLKRLPRVECPSWHSVAGAAADDARLRSYETYDFMLPFPLPEDTGDEVEVLASKDALFVEERYRYMHSRVYGDKASDCELVRAVQRLEGFGHAHGALST
ncbi:Uu.00g041250.m01.CDS01 [Anthostomella pinea]|uniref:Uu.00g041250.m01.CDS01 n=1 Tax=Anthostomella pinea TaxID=933095 RepID=A0AAI8YE10_9PEZI|nr:Uu.00g041250.m01.CDS01 [Anthostomella pinea]